jgi:hypothetical protein
MPFSHGVKGQGIATIEDYEVALGYAQKKGEFIGSEPHLYPYDFGIYFRYEKDLKRKLPEQFPTDEKLTIEKLNQFHQEAKERYKVVFSSEV